MLRIMKAICAGGIATILCGPMANFAKADVTTIRFLSSFPETGVSKQTMVPFAEGIEKASGGQIKVVRSGPAAVPPFQQLRPLSMGVVDMLFTTPAYHQADTGVGALLDGAFIYDPKKMQDSGLRDKINKYYREKFGVEIIAIVPGAPTHFILKDQLDKDGRLAGKKISATPAVRGAVEALGGVPVNMRPTDVYTAMQKGTVDGIAFPQHASAEYGFDQVGSYMTRPAFGHQVQVVMVNSERFKAWPESVQKLVLEQAREFEQKAPVVVGKIIEEANKKLAAGGLKEIQFPEKIASELEGLFFDGVLQTAMRSDPDAVKEIIEFARQKGMTIK